MIYLGIDPGVTGWIAAIEDFSKGCRVSFAGPLGMMTGHEFMSCIWEAVSPGVIPSGTCLSVECHAVTEEVSQMPMHRRTNRETGASEMVFPMKAVRSLSGFAKAIEWSLSIMGVPMELVKPKHWQKAMLAGMPTRTREERLSSCIRRAQQLFPGVDLRISDRGRKPSHDKAVALLLAEYGRRTYSKGAIP